MQVASAEARNSHSHSSLAIVPCGRAPSTSLQGRTRAVLRPLLLAILAALPTQQALSQDDDTLLRIELRARNFLEGISKANVEPAVDELLVRSPLLKDEPQVTQLKQGIRKGLDRYGKFLRIEKLKVSRIGRSVVRCVYLYHCQEYPVAWTFTFYRSDEEQPWNLISLRYGLEYDTLPSTQ